MGRACYLLSGATALVKSPFHNHLLAISKTRSQLSHCPATRFSRRDPLAEPSVLSSPQLPLPQRSPLHAYLPRQPSRSARSIRSSPSAVFGPVPYDRLGVWDDSHLAPHALHCAATDAQFVRHLQHAKAGRERSLMAVSVAADTLGRPIAFSRRPCASRRTLPAACSAWARWRPAFTRDWIMARSNYENTPNIPNIARPDAVVVSRPMLVNEQIHLRTMQILHRRDQVRQRAAEPIRRPDHDQLANRRSY